MQPIRSRFPVVAGVVTVVIFSIVVGTMAASPEPALAEAASQGSASTHSSVESGLPSAGTTEGDSNAAAWIGAVAAAAAAASMWISCMPRMSEHLSDQEIDAAIDRHVGEE